MKPKAGQVMCLSGFCCEYCSVTYPSCMMNCDDLKDATNICRLLSDKEVPNPASFVE